MTSARTLLRYLRISTTVFFAVLSVALIVLWVRSYSHSDAVRWYRPSAQRREIHSSQGRLVVCSFAASSNKVAAEWTAFSQEISEIDAEMLRQEFSTYDLILGFGAVPFLTRDYMIHFPHWLPVLLCATLAAAAWIKSLRFSLRTLLIATTIIAVVLGMRAVVGR